MKRPISLVHILKWAILIIVPVGIGTFVDVNVLEKLDINVWLARGIGCLITVIIGLILHHYFFGKKAS